MCFYKYLKDIAILYIYLRCLHFDVIITHQFIVTKSPCFIHKNNAIILYFASKLYFYIWHFTNYSEHCAENKQFHYNFTTNHVICVYHQPKRPAPKETDIPNNGSSPKISEIRAPGTLFSGFPL